MSNVKRQCLKRAEMPQAAAASAKPKSTYIDLTRDYGFKIVMADPDHPELLMRFLNEIIPEHDIVSITFLNTEVLPSDEEDKRTNYDVQCIDGDGNRFLVEMQKSPYDHFNDRLMVYSGDPLRHLLKVKEKYADVRSLYVVSILGGYLQVEGEDSSYKRELIRRASVRMDNSGKILSDKLNFIFLQLLEARTLRSEASFLERWSYYVRRIGGMNEKPQGLEPYFDLLFEAADRKNIEQGKLSIYDKMVRDEIQIEAEKEYAVREALETQAAKNSKALEAARLQAMRQGIEQNRIENARKLKEVGISAEIISQCTGLTFDEVSQL